MYWKEKQIWLRRFRDITMGYSSWFCWFPPSLFMMMVMISPISLLQEGDWKGPHEVISLCQCQQDTVVLHNFRRSWVNFFQNLPCHVNLQLKDPLESNFSLYRSKTEAHRGEGTCPKSPSRLMAEPWLGISSFQTPYSFQQFYGILQFL